MLRRLPIVGTFLVLLIGPVSAQTPGLIAGVVRTPDSTAGGARVVLSGNSSQASTADSAGHFLFSDVPPGQYLLVASLPGWSTTTVGATVRGGDTVTLTIVLGPPPQLPEVVVTAARVPNYLADSATGGTKFPVSLMDVPQAITVVDQDLINDQHITQSHDITRNVAGVTPIPPYTGAGLNEATFLFRGLPSPAPSNTLRDGFRDYGALVPIDMSSVDHVEFLMGPESVLYGATGSLSGLANFVSKQPLAHRAAALTLSADVHGDVRTTVDLGGPFSSSGSGKVRYRLNLAGERIRGFSDYTAGSYAFSLAPVIEWLPGARTTVTATVSYVQRQYRGDPFLPLYPGFTSLPVTTFYGEPSAPKSFAQGLTSQLVLTYQASRSVRLREGLGYFWVRLSDYNYDLRGLDTLGTSLIRGYGHSDEYDRIAASQTELFATFMTGGVRNRLVAGLELSSEQHPAIADTGVLLPLINLHHPVYTGLTPDTSPFNHYLFPMTQAAVYAQDLLDFGRHVKVILGARWDYNWSESTSLTPPDTVVDTVRYVQAVHHISPRAGFVVQPGPSTSLYASWTTSFWPNRSCARCNDPKSWPPQVGDQFEIGDKQLFAHGRFATTLSLYQITMQNLLVGDPTDPMHNRLISIGAIQARGVDLQASGTPAPGLGMMASYAHSESYTSRGNVYFPVGIPINNLSRNRFSIWSTYTVRNGSIRGMEFGGGLTIADGQFANWNEPFRLPGYTMLDALLAYHGRSFGAQVNLTNLTDARSYQGVTDYQVSPGAPRSAVTTISYQF